MRQPRPEAIGKMRGGDKDDAFYVINTFNPFVRLFAAELCKALHDSRLGTDDIDDLLDCVSQEVGWYAQRDATLLTHAQINEKQREELRQVMMNPKPIMVWNGGVNPNANRGR